MSRSSDGYPRDAEQTLDQDVSEEIVRVPPIRLLVVTPLHLFLFDARSGRLTELRSGDGEYYGLTWMPGAILVGHSHVNNEELLTHEDFVGSDRGEVASYAADGCVLARTQRRLLNAHQIEWAHDCLLVVDTGRERLSVYATDGSLIRDVALGDRFWDRGPDGRFGHHFNSVHRSADRVWIVAHNHERPSEVWELSWPELEIVEIHTTDAAWAHNVWNGSLGLVICDSRSGRLHEVRSRETIWTPGEDGVITRGLAVSAEHLFIGCSQPGGRGERKVNEGGLWVVDRATLTTVARFRFPGSGCINEIRLLDGPDECHNGEPFDNRLLLALSGNRKEGGEESVWSPGLDAVGNFAGATV